MKRISHRDTSYEWVTRSPANRRTSLLFTHLLSFEIRIAQTTSDLVEARRVRALSYGHHLPELGQQLLAPEPPDVGSHTFVVLCEDKATGSVVGTARFQTNIGGPLLIERSIALPSHMQSDTRAEVSRLSAVRGSDPLVKLALMKASYLFCMVNQVRWLVICARNMALMRQYERLGFTSIFGPGVMAPMLHVGNLDHHVLNFNVTTAESRWREEQHPLYEFMIETVHPDIQLLTTPLVRKPPSIDSLTLGHKGSRRTAPAWVDRAIFAVSEPDRRQYE